MHFHIRKGRIIDIKDFTNLQVAKFFPAFAKLNFDAFGGFIREGAIGCSVWLSKISLKYQ